ncbi:MAG: GNAT family N-acetyltransferase [Bacteroidota bacterium]
MQDDQLIIRDGEPADIFALADLMNELGYKTTADEMKMRFEPIHNHHDYKTLVALIDKTIVGMAGLSRNYSYEQNGTYVRVGALVTSTRFRQRGVGKHLMEAAENWARDIGSKKVLLNCGNRDERIVAQNFYKKIGYEVKSSGFVKELTSTQ